MGQTGPVRRRLATNPLFCGSLPAKGGCTSYATGRRQLGWNQSKIHTTFCPWSRRCFSPRSSTHATMLQEWTCFPPTTLWRACWMARTTPPWIHLSFAETGGFSFPGRLQAGDYIQYGISFVELTSSTATTSAHPTYGKLQAVRLYARDGLRWDVAADTVSGRSILLGGHSITRIRFGYSEGLREFAEITDQTDRSSTWSFCTDTGALVSVPGHDVSQVRDSISSRSRGSFQSRISGRMRPKLLCYVHRGHIISHVLQSLQLSNNGIILCG